LKACKLGGCWKECNEVKSQLFLDVEMSGLGRYETGAANHKGTSAFYRDKATKSGDIPAINQPETGFSFSCYYINGFTFS
jgi:hypothetical protein